MIHAENTVLAKNLEEALSSVEPDVKLNSEQRSRLIMGLQRLVYAIEKELTIDIVRDPYQRIGIHPFNVDNILSISKADLDIEMVDNIKSNLDEITDEFIKEGFLSEEFLDRMNIPDTQWDGKGARRDELVLYRQRATWLNCIRTKNRFEEYVYRRDKLPEERRQAEQGRKLQREEERQQRQIKREARKAAAAKKKMRDTKFKLRKAEVDRKLTVYKKWAKFAKTVLKSIPQEETEEADPSPTVSVKARKRGVPLNDLTNNPDHGTPQIQYSTHSNRPIKRKKYE